MLWHLSNCQSCFCFFCFIETLNWFQHVFTLKCTSWCCFRWHCRCERLPHLFRSGIGTLLLIHTIVHIPAMFHRQLFCWSLNWIQIKSWLDTKWCHIHQDWGLLIALIWDPSRFIDDSLGRFIPALSSLLMTVMMIMVWYSRPSSWLEVWWGEW